MDHILSDSTIHQLTKVRVILNGSMDHNMIDLEIKNKNIWESLKHLKIEQYNYPYPKIKKETREKKPELNKNIDILYFLSD